MTPEYISMCRELQLCDWRGPCGKGWPPDSRWIPKGARRPRLVANAGAPFKNEGATWLPREGDWLDLLDAEGWCDVRLYPGGMGVHAEAYGRGGLCEDDGSDRLTALARLYAAAKRWGGP